MILLAGSLSPLAAATLRVAAVQLRSGSDLAANVAAIKQHLADCAARKVQIVAFPECAVSSYFPEEILKLPAERLVAAEQEIARACATHRIAAIVGIPERRGEERLNCALIIDASGRIIGRYYKAHLVGQDVAWKCSPGTDVPPVFSVEGVPASVIICHDSRYPELCRLPVLAGARVVFYISHEAGLSKENKLVPYRAQVQARAVENRIFVVHANAPADDIRKGSHGQSRIVAPDGNLMQEASQLQEEVLVADLNLAEATAETALKSLDGPLADWWRAGVKRVRMIK
jgi:predicted amidohydrolase